MHWHFISLFFAPFLFPLPFLLVIKEREGTASLLQISFQNFEMLYLSQLLMRRWPIRKAIVKKGKNKTFTRLT